MGKKSIKERKISIKCLRFDPSLDSEPYYQEYSIYLEFGMSVTNILDYIYYNLDSSLAYYANCHRGICGLCGVLVNGKKKLACTELVKGDLILEPLPDRRVIRDLVTEEIQDS